jgi:D-sedoheptulose 7-phosphate isomerase
MELFTRYPALVDIKDDIDSALNLMLDCYRNGGKILICGNGGSSADSAHIAGELLKDFAKKRPIDDDFKAKLSAISNSAKDTACVLQKGVPCIDLTALNATLTAIGNDINFDYGFAQIFYSLASKNDLLIGLSTSGNSKNVVKAVEVAKALNIKTIGFTGAKGGNLNDLCDVCIKAPATETYKVQEYHLPIYHYLCLQIENTLF